nr:restriction endonuclease subunit S [uncultured Alistipes sp.]
MKLPQGYKQTELGVIPEDWEISAIRDSIELLTDFDANGSFADVATNVTTYDGDGYAWYVRATDLERNPPLSQLKYVDSNSYKFLKKSSLYGSEVLLTKRGEIGKVYQFKTRTKYATLAPNLYLLKFKEKINSTYLFYFLKSDLGNKQLRDINATTSLGALYKEDVKNVNILCPNIKEQQIIAEALSDVDTLIAALDKKITKKRLIKQGAMIRLLGGKGKKLGDPKIKDIVSIKKGDMLTSGQYITGHIPVIAGGKSAAGYHNVANRQANTITISASGASAGYVAFHDYPIFATDCSTIEPSKSYDIKYIYYLLLFYQSELYALQTGGAQPHVHPNDIYDLNIHYNSDIETQRKIATILSDMDKEIADLEARRDKYKLVKSGMMQKLLTGQIRLIKPQAKIIPLTTQIPATRDIPVAAHVLAGHIVYRSHQSRGWGRTKLQKSLHLIGYSLQLNLGNEYIRNTAGPDDQLLMNYIDQKLKNFHHVNIVKEVLRDGRTHYTYTPTTLIQDVEMAYEQYPQDVREQIDALLDKLNTLDLAGTEILSTLYAVWNNRLIKGEQITDNLLISDFYAWSAHKADFEETRVRNALDYMRKENIIPVGWGKYIDKK